MILFIINFMIRILVSNFTVFKPPPLNNRHKTTNRAKS